ncbi:MAG: chorismate mutase [Pseudomonadota bacterium]
MMHERPPRPEHCAPLDPVSSGVEAIDQQILQLLSQRFALARAVGAGGWEDADDRRKAISAIRSRAFELGVPVGLVADFWDRMAEASLAMRDQAFRS